eukprot:2809239-Alexandrium_andersonii.AAC.1
MKSESFAPARAPCTPADGRGAPTTPSEACGRRPGPGGSGQRATNGGRSPSSSEGATVSYTHLTLPTICSV